MKVTDRYQADSNVHTCVHLTTTSRMFMCTGKLKLQIENTKLKMNISTVIKNSQHIFFQYFTVYWYYLDRFVLLAQLSA